MDSNITYRDQQVLRQRINPKLQLAKIVDAHTRFDVQQAFVATAEDIRKMWKTLGDSEMKIVATVKCSDGLVRKFLDVELLAQYENPKRARISAIEIAGRTREPYATAEIALGAHYSAPVSVSIRGEEVLVSSMRTSLTDTLDGMRPWYSRISTVDLFYVWFPIFMVLGLLVQIMGPSSVPKPAIPLKKALEILAVAVTVIAMIGATIWTMAWLRKRFFPVATFAIGQGVARHQHNEQVRWVVIVGFLVGVAASVITAILFGA
jgi:hypothetical protein